MKKGLICFFTAISICISSFVQKPLEPFVNGDRVVFAENRIPEAGSTLEDIIAFQKQAAIKIIGSM